MVRNVSFQSTTVVPDAALSAIAAPSPREEAALAVAIVPAVAARAAASIRTDLIGFLMACSWEVSSSAGRVKVGNAVADAAGS
jgi:hypothetical protein